MTDGVTANIAKLMDNQLDVVVPSGQLVAGIHSLQVVQKVMLPMIKGQPPVQRGGFSSNAVGFQLIPKITGTPTTDAIGQIVSVPVQPAVKSTQEASLLLGDYVVPRVPSPAGSPPTTTLKFQLPQKPNTRIPPEKYLVRVRVDGAESRLQVDTDPNSPTYLQYSGPFYTVP
jgi:hypothetical protein